jgi:GNAT superfamily N-acetyltransferase
MAIDFRLLRESDLPAASRLKSLAQWNQSDNDWRRLLELEPDGCFCATSEDRVVATTTTTTYGKDLAWIGMVLVDPEYRRRGIATELMKIALDYLNSLEVRTIKLDATPAGLPVYERLGFKQESLVERWEGIASVNTNLLPSAQRELGTQIYEFDREGFGTDRSKLIDLLSRDSCVAPQYVSDDAGRLSGYGLAREGSVASYLGPVVAKDERSAKLVCDGILGQLMNQRVYVDLNTNFAGGRRMLSECGFAKQRDLVRMTYGDETKAGSNSFIVAIAGPEVG